MKNNDSKHRGLLKFLSILVGLVTAILLISMLDGISYFILKIEQKATYPILYDGSANVMPELSFPFIPSDKYTYFDPHLGYAHNPDEALDQGDKPGFAVYGDMDKVGKSLKIVILGSSLTDGNYAENWAKELYKIMISQGYQVQILNGSVAGFSSNQYLVKMIRDVIPLKPDLIISFSGLNDVGFYGALDKHPMVNSYQASLMQYLTQKRSAFLPNTSGLIDISLENIEKQRQRGIIYGPEVNTTPAVQWEHNNRLMAAIAKEFKIPFLVFLEPGLGVGKYELSTAEQEVFNSYTKKIDINYPQKLSEFYRDARIACQLSNNSIDLSDIFAGQKNIYTDNMNPTALGNQMIAEEVLKTLKSRFGDILSKN
jgi:lysophospholipase L1-like esterase